MWWILELLLDIAILLWLISVHHLLLGVPRLLFDGHFWKPFLDCGHHFRLALDLQLGSFHLLGAPLDTHARRIELVHGISRCTVHFENRMGCGRRYHFFGKPERLSVLSLILGHIFIGVEIGTSTAAVGLNNQRSWFFELYLVAVSPGCRYAGRLRSVTDGIKFSVLKALWLLSDRGINPTRYRNGGLDRVNMAQVHA